jgi:hypothetical protein
VTNKEAQTDEKGDETDMGTASGGWRNAMMAAGHSILSGQDLPWSRRATEGLEMQRVWHRVREDGDPL